MAEASRADAPVENDVRQHGEVETRRFGAVQPVDEEPGPELLSRMARNVRSTGAATTSLRAASSAPAQPAADNAC